MSLRNKSNSPQARAVLRVFNMRELCSYAIIQFRWPIMAFGYLQGKKCKKCSLAYCLPLLPKRQLRRMDLILRWLAE